MTGVKPMDMDELNRLLTNVVMNIPKFRPVVWFEAGMDQFTIVTRDVSWRNHFVRNASIELLFHPHKRVVIGLHITSAVHLVKQNYVAFTLHDGEISALKILRLAKQRDMEIVGALSKEALSAYRKAESLLKRHAITLSDRNLAEALSGAVVRQHARYLAVFGSRPMENLE